MRAFPFCPVPSVQFQKESFITLSEVNEMAKNRNFPVEDLTYRRLKAYAAYQGVTIGEAIKILLDCQDIPATATGPDYAKWLNNLHEIARTQGEDAAVKEARENPYAG